MEPKINLDLQAKDGSLTPSKIAATGTFVFPSLEITATDKGFVLPRLTTLERDNIVSPETGSEIFNTTIAQPEVYNGTIWTSMGGGTSPTVQSYTPTFAGLGTVSNVQAFYKSDGVSVEVWGTVKAGVTTATIMTISVPIPINATHLPTTSAFLGSIYAIDTGGLTTFAFYDGSDTGNVYLGYAGEGPTGASSPTKKNANFITNTNDYVQFQFSYPIA